LNKQKIFFVGTIKELPPLIKSSKKKIEIFTTSYLTHKLNIGNVKYLFSEFDGKEIKSLESFAQNWYLDNKSQDLSIIDNISIGRLYSRRFIRNFSNLLKCIKVINKLNLEKSEIYCVNIEKIFLESLNLLKIKYKLINYDNQFNGETFPERAFFFKNPPVSFKTKILKTIFDFKIFDFLKRNKTIYIFDNFIERNLIKDSHYLEYRGINPLKNFYFDDNKIDVYESLFYINLSSSLKKFFNNKTIKNNFNKSNIKKIISYELFNRIIYDDIINNKFFISRAVFIIRKLVKRYIPKKIVTYTPNDFLTSIIYDTKNKNCTLEIIQDGYFIPYSSSFLLKDKQKIIYDKYLCHNHMQKEMLLKLKMEIENIRILTTKKNEKKLTKITKIYDLIIFAYYPNLYNPSSIHDSAIYNEFLIIKKFINLGFKNFAIKVKKGSLGNFKTRFKKIYEYFDTKINAINIDIIDENIDEIINNKLFIGPISSTLFELKFFNKNIILFEPLSNGVRDYEKKAFEKIYKCKIYRNINQILNDRKINLIKYVNNP